MNVFYAPPEQINDNVIELTGQEAVHASKALRYQRGDAITVVDGEGSWYEGEVALIARDRVQVAISKSEQKKRNQPSFSLAMGIIKKRDRLEFAVEKAVELGAKEIILFRSEHSVKQNVKADRLESIILSAMKQSLQCWLPKLRVFGSLEEMVAMYAGYDILVAHQQGEPVIDIDLSNDGTQDCLMVVGPEGGLSDNEIERLKEKRSRLVSLGPNRLRAETAVVSFLSICRNI